MVLLWKIKSWGVGIPNDAKVLALHFGNAHPKA